MSQEINEPRRESDSAAGAAPGVNNSLPHHLISTWDVLKSLGFTEDRSAISDPPGGLSLDFGNFKLSAHFVINRYFRPIVLLDGIVQTARTFGEVECQMAREVESWEQGVAWVTFCLDKYASDGGLFVPRRPTPWLAVGRDHRHLLPWERELAAYAARPNCSVKRDWARLALRTLSDQLTAADDDSLVTLHFDGDVLTIRCAGQLIAAPATGKPWPGRYSILVKSLRRLPKRLMREQVEFSVFDAALTINNRRYPGVVQMDMETTNGS